MKKVLLLALFASSIICYSYAQNRLSPVWKYYKTNDIKAVEGTETANWPEVNLLLSWERQGLCWLDQGLVLKNSFFADEKDSPLQLSFSLQGDVQAVYVNQKQVVGKIPNSFWSERGKKQQVIIPDSLLHQGGKNEIAILITNLSYTGGLSHNFCSLQALNASSENAISISFPVEQHVFQSKDKRLLTIKTRQAVNARVKLLINSDFHQTVFNEYIDMKPGASEYVFDLAPLHLAPGFYECVAISEGETYCGAVEWFAVDPEGIVCSAEKIPGFDDYWQAALKELETVEPDYHLEKIDSLCSASRDAYVVEMSSLRNLRIRGYYFVPKNEGKHPAILNVPGYGYGYQNLEEFTSRKDDIAELALCVRGHGISSDVFNPWDTIAFWAVGACDKNEYIYRAVYMDCVRAIDFLLSQPTIDKNKIGVLGGSQGGGLALATAGLCKNNIAACGIFDPWLCDIRHQANIRTTINQEIDFFATYPSVDCDAEQTFAVLDFVDTKYFATDITCPVRFAASLFDDDCPVHNGFSAYNNIKTDKKYFVYPNDSHLAESGQYNDLYEMVKELLMSN